MPVWERYSEKIKFTYRDSVVWEKHTVDKGIISKVIRDVESQSVNQEKLYNEFTDPVVALQDEDWRLPESAEKIFYSAYNLICALVEKDKSSEYFYLSINQAIDVIDAEKVLSEDEIKEILEENKK